MPADKIINLTRLSEYDNLIKEYVDDDVVDISISGRTVTITKKDGTTKTQTTQDTNTHYASKNVVNSSDSATTDTTTAITNGNVKLNHVENNAVTDSHAIFGTGSVQVTSDAFGNINVNGNSNADITYDASTGTISL